MQRWLSVPNPLRRKKTAEEGEVVTRGDNSGSGRSFLGRLSPRERAEARRVSEGGGAAEPITVISEHDGRSRDDVLGELNMQYYEADFDPVSFEIKGLPFELDEALLEEVVQERVAVLEVLNEKLSDEVQSRSERIVSGVNEVASVEHDLQVAHIVTRNARRNLATALEEVAANTRIAEKTRQKQTLLETLEVLLKLQAVANMECRHSEFQEAGDFARAIATSDECVSALTGDADLSRLRVANALADAACDRYRMTIKEMDTALLSVCADFNEELYARILDAYKGLPEHGELADKVQACFSKVVDTTVNGVVFSYVMQRGIKFERSAALPELCRQLSSELFRPCLSKVLEVAFDLLNSHWRMMQWHVERLGVQQAQVEALMGEKEAWVTAREGDQESGGAGAGGEFPQDETLMEAGALYEVLQVVLTGGLQEGREGVWDAVARCVQQLLNAPGAAEGEHFLQVLDWMHRFIKVGESFSSKNAGWLLRDCLARQSGAFFGAFHRQNLDALGSMLEKEAWRCVLGCAVPSMRETLKRAGASTATAVGDNEGDEPAAFGEWAAAGNPFAEGATGRRTSNRGRTAIQLGFEGNTYADGHDRNGGGRGNGTASNGGSPRSTSDGEVGGDGDGEESDEPEELRGDFIDEESQSVRVGEGTQSSVSSSGRPDQPTITPTSLKLFKWMVSYGQLMCVLGPASPQVFKGLCDLFDAYLFHIFQTFGNVTVAALAEASVEVGGGEEVTPRLRKTLLRIGGYPADYVPGSRPSDMTTVTAIGGSPGGPGGTKTVVTAAASSTDRWRRSSLFKATRDKLAGMGHVGGGTEMGAMSNNLVSSGNMFALKERSVAVESLMAVAEELHRSKMSIQAALPAAESQRLDHFYTRTVDAASDLQEHIFHAASLRLLDLSRYPPRIAETKYDVTEVGCEASGWVEPALADTRQFAEKLTVAGVGSATRRLMWEKAMDATAQTLLEGISRVKRCTIEGRAAMSLDLQTLIRGLSGIVPEGIELDVQMRIVDTYIKAFYMPEDELVHWAHTHPEYTRSQLVNLVTCIADNGKWKRKTLRELLAQIETI